MKKRQQSEPGPDKGGAPFIAAHLFIKAAGISPTTFWRWCKAGRFNPVNINGRKYLNRLEEKKDQPHLQLLVTNKSRDYHIALKEGVTG